MPIRKIMPDLGIGRARDKAADQMVELRLIAQASENDFGSEPGIAGIERSRVLEQQVGCIAALGNFLEYVEGDLARAADTKYQFSWWGRMPSCARLSTAPFAPPC